MQVNPIDLLLPELFAADGGIQRYSHTLIKAILKVRPNIPLRVFIRNDRPNHLPSNFNPLIQWYPSCGSSARMAISLVRASLRQRPSLLISTHPNFAPLQALHHCFTGVPSWCTAHGIEVWSLGHGPKRWALSSLQALLPVSSYSARRLRAQLGSACPPMTVIPNTFDQSRFYPGPRSSKLLLRYSLKPDQPVIFSLSRLTRSDSYKNLDKLIEALPPLLSRWPDLCLLIAGEGDDKARLRNLAVRLGVSNNVILCGRIDESELVDHHRLASVFALPSTGEGFGIVFLESLGCGRPVLAGNRDGSVDPLSNGRFGLLVDPYLPLAPSLASLLACKGEDLWFQPDSLSKEVGNAFGFSAFCQRLAAQLDTLVTDQCAV